MDSSHGTGSSDLGARQLVEKRAAAEAVARLVADGMRLGLGSGSTVALVVSSLAPRLREGLRPHLVVAASVETERLALAAGLPLVPFDDGPLDLAIDGADEVDPELNLLKGGGGALVRERIMATAARRIAIAVDSTKLVPRLGTRAHLPIEVHVFGAEATRRRLAALLGAASFREREGKRFVSDNGGFIIDGRLPAGADLEGLATTLRMTPGVVDHGLFLGLHPEVFVGETSPGLPPLVRKLQPFRSS
jgi:ribose 5-phosphate isomerase A